MRRAAEYLTVAGHGLMRSITLHLLPGAAITAFYVAAAPLVMAWGYPPLFALIISTPVVTLPALLGYLFYQARRGTGRWNVQAVIDYRQTLSWRRYVLLGGALLLWTAIVYAVDAALVGPAVIEGAFGWLPDWFRDPQNLDQIAAMPSSLLIVFFASWFVFICVAGPIVEELYFRGHLLPGLTRYRAWAPLLNTVLFSLYHFWTPWQNPARILALLPLVYLVWYNRSIQLSIGFHVVANTLNLFVLIAGVVALR